ncbi:MAG: thiamine pyrophosphate-dependent enzyme [Bacteroidetes bacterium]|nr:thiamine pyrophosphate-dependent enzyme [Bacteroidota bacterium]
METAELTNSSITLEEFKKTVLDDYKLGMESRHASLLGRKEVLTGKAKFGIFGDGKEVAQIAMAKAFKNGDFRSGYYRDQTFMFAIGESDVKKFFAQLYADTDINNEPASGGRQMNGHFATRSLDENGDWKNLMEIKNSSADISPTASQMLRLVGLAYASKLYRNNPDLHQYNTFSNQGNEVAFGTIGNASTAEGIFWESINAAGVLMVPMAVSIWDDGYGISVPNKYQVTKQDLSEILSGFAYNEEKEGGYQILSANGWDYPALVKMYNDGINICRENHRPTIFHVKELTQPQGHSTSGSHERYKSKERLAWEEEFDCLKQMRKWMIESTISTDEELDEIEKNAKDYVRKMQKEALEDFLSSIKKTREELSGYLEEAAAQSNLSESILAINQSMKTSLDVDKKTQAKAAWEFLRITKDENLEAKAKVIEWRKNIFQNSFEDYNDKLYSGNALKVAEVLPQYADDAAIVDGREVLVAFFEQAFANNPRIFAFGEDVGKIGDVNQGLAGMQEKFGELRITDTGIREASIVGQGIGAAMRGLRPIAEIQYLDYLLYGLQILSDDLSTLYYRTKGGQKAPLIIRTRGHRLEGVWHSGSPMGMIIHALRGMYVCVPRSMTQAARFYNTLLNSDEPGLIIERLNAYRIKEKMPSNLGEMYMPLGVPETIVEGKDVTIVTYGPCVDIAAEAITKLNETGISVELIDVQTLLPFDVNHSIVNSIKKTNRILFLDEDVPGGATSYMMQQVLEVQGGYAFLDSQPKTLTSHAHRPAYGSDGDYFSKPNAEDIYNIVYQMMNESNPQRFPLFL